MVNKFFQTFVLFVVCFIVSGLGVYAFYAQYVEDENSSDNLIEVFYSFVPPYGTVDKTSEYEVLSDKINEKYTYYNQLKENGSIYSAHDMEDNDASRLYVQSFLNRLILQKQELESIKDIKVQDDDNYSLKLNDIDIEVQLLEKTFIAGGDFDPVEVVDQNGDRIIDQGVNGNRAKMIDDDLLEKESDARKVFARGDSFDDEAEKLANIFDMQIIYGLDNMPEACSRNSSHNYETVVALVCSADTSEIYVNEEHSNGELWKQVGYVDYIKHEIAHKLIYERCGTMMPEIAGDSYESVTSSYAVKYLGADYIVLQSSSETFSEYKMTDESDDIATTIHDKGVCN